MKRASTMDENTSVNCRRTERRGNQFSSSLCRALCRALSLSLSRARAALALVTGERRRGGAGEQQHKGALQRCKTMAATPEHSEEPLHEDLDDLLDSM
jgi:hypothetical protein